MKQTLRRGVRRLWAALRWRGTRRVGSYLLLLIALTFLPLTVLYAAVIGRQAAQERSRSRHAVTAISRSVAKDFGTELLDARHLAETIAARPGIVAADPSACSAVLGDVVDLLPLYVAARVIGHQGETVCQRGGALAAPGLLSSTALTAALQNGITTIGEPYLAAGAQHWGVTVFAPIRDQRTDATTGAVALTLDVQHFQEHLAGMAWSTNSVATLISANSVVMARSQDADRWIGQDISATTLGAHIRQGRAGVAQLSGLDGVPRTTGFHTVPGADWKLVVALHADTSASRMLAVVIAGALGGVPLLGLTGALALLIGRRITRPLQALAATSRAVAGGDTTARVAVSGPAEVAETAHAFNAMLDARERTAGRLARSEALHRAITEHFPDGIIMLFDSDLRLLAVGGRGLAQLNLTPERLIGQRLSDITSPRFVERTEPLWRTTLSGASSMRELEWLGRWYEVAIHPVADERGQIWAGLVVAMDRTAHREAEQEQERLRRQAMQAAATAEAERLRTEILNTVSHELRTPLGAIKGFTSTLLAFGDIIGTGERQEFLHEIEQAANRLSGLVESLLALAAAEQSPAPAIRRPITTVDVIPAAIERAALAFPGRHITLEQPPEPRLVLADAARLRRALGALLDNALTYSAAPSPVVLRVEATADGGTAIHVIDQGPGIPSEEHGRIFERLQRGRAALRSDHRGAGAGLALCRRLVEEEGGRIELASEPGQGSRFSIILPPATPPPADAPHALATPTGS